MQSITFTLIEGKTHAISKKSIMQATTLYTSKQKQKVV